MFKIKNLNFAFANSRMGFVSLATEYKKEVFQTVNISISQIYKDATSSLGKTKNNIKCENCHDGKKRNNRKETDRNKTMNQNDKRPTKQRNGVIY